eukprot:1394208-Amorphochlora_amoeboformis.AAC.1
MIQHVLVRGPLNPPGEWGYNAVRDNSRSWLGLIPELWSDLYDPRGFEVHALPVHTKLFGLELGLALGFGFLFGLGLALGLGVKVEVGTPARLKLLGDVDLGSLFCYGEG